MNEMSKYGVMHVNLNGTKTSINMMTTLLILHYVHSQYTLFSYINEHVCMTAHFLLGWLIHCTIKYNTLFILHLAW
jgi:hypothetical protein